MNRMTAIVLAPAQGVGTQALVSALRAGLGFVVLVGDRAAVLAALQAHPRAALILDLRSADEDLHMAVRLLRRELPATHTAALIGPSDPTPLRCDAVFREPVFLEDVVRWCARSSARPAAEDLLEDLAAGLCHEIGNPLTSVFLQLELLRTEEDLETVRTHLQLIEESARRIQAVVRDVAETAERHPVRSVSCRLHSLVEMARAQVYERMPSFVGRIELSGQDAELSADGALLAAAVADLAEYLLRADDGDGVVTIEALPKQDTGHLIRLTAATGRLPRDAAGRLFTPLWARQALGLPEGLSLTSARNAFLRHRGDVRARALTDGAMALEAWLPEGDQGELPFDIIGAPG